MEKKDYFFNEFFEAGIVLMGSEVKSLRDGKANISESYALDEDGEIFKVDIPEFPLVLKKIMKQKGLMYYMMFIL